MHNLKIDIYLKAIFLISLVSIISAFYIEYALGQQPCNLCLMQRIPYGLSIILVVLNFFLRKNEQFIILLLIFTFCFSFIISLIKINLK